MGAETPVGPATPDEFPFAGAPRLELDELLGQLIERAQDVLGAQSRLQGLLAANQSIIGDLTLPVVLRRIVEAACRLVGARYGALGVLAPVGGLEEFIYVGIDEPTAARIGHLPTGKGLLGALIDDPRPIRLERMSDDYRSVGFPENHPPMASFLGVPIRVRDAVFGNLYLSEARSGAFSADDVELVTALAATAGIAIENARLFAQAQHRQQWLEASAVITRQLLSIEGEDPLALIARRAAEVADADLVTVVLPTADPGRLLVEVASGARADELAGYTYPQEGSLVGAVLESGQPMTIADAGQEHRYPVHQMEVLPVGPVMVLPLAGARGPRGALMVGRVSGRHPFDDADVAMALAFAGQAALALELADARADQLRMEVLEDRDRIARDLHDHVIQRLFAVGLTVQGLAARATDPKVAERLARVIDDVDVTIAQIRTSVFELRGHLGPQNGSARRQVLDVVAEVAPLLPSPPDVRFSGPVDSVVPEEVLGDLLAVTREALTNIARHARASAADIVLTATADTLSLRVSDNGVGLGDAERRSGIENLRRRAEKWGGTLELAQAPSAEPERTTKGTCLTWSIKLP